jgi:hypothetical protein
MNLMNLRTRLLFGVVVVTSAACTDDSGAAVDSSATVDGGLDASRSVVALEAGLVMDAGGLTKCGPYPVCDRGVGIALPNLCTTVLPFQNRSAGLWPVCIASPDGVVYGATFAGDEYVSSPGWKHPNYGNVTDNTLLPAELQACSELRLRQWDASIGCRL